MTDLIDVIPDFPSDEYADLITALETHLISTSDLLTLDGLEIARRAHVPILDLKRFVEHVCSHLHQSYGFHKEERAPSRDSNEKQTTSDGQQLLTKSGLDLASPGTFISTLDEALDTALNGGIAPGYLTEVTGERYAMFGNESLRLMSSVVLERLNSY